MRRTISLVGVLLRLLTRRLSWLLGFTACVAIVLMCYFTEYQLEPALAVHMTAYGQLLITLEMMLLGIQLELEPGRISMAEVIDAYSHRAHTFLICKFIAITLVSLIFTVLISAAACFTLVHSNSSWTQQVLLHIVLVYLLPMCVYGNAGMLFAKLFRSRNAYFFALLFWFCTSSLVVDYVGMLASAGLHSGAMAQTMLNLGVANMRQIQGTVMSQPVETPRFIVRLAMLFATGALCWGCESARRQDLRRAHGALRLAASVALCAAVGTLCVAQYGTFFDRFADAEARLAYAQDKLEQYEPGHSVSLNGFPTEKRIAIEQCDIDVRTTVKGLDVSVDSVAFATEDVDAQSFTLYSDLQVDGVWVDGQAAQFERSNDGLLVYFSQPKAQGERVSIRFEYHGYSLPLYPANETTVQLHRAFPWLPWPGLRNALMYENFYGYEQSEAFFVEDWQRADEISYVLRYSGPGDLYTNLVNVGGNEYAGTCAGGISLYSGMVCSEQRGVNVYMPAGQYENAPHAANAVLDSFEAIDSLCAMLGVERMPEQPRTICVLEMDAPIILGYPFSSRSELYSWGGEWEIRQRSSSEAIGRRERYGEDVRAYKMSDKCTGAAVAYVISPASGYPVDVPHSSTKNFAYWLYSYLRLSSSADEDMEEHRMSIYDNCIGDGSDYIAGERVREIPASEDALARIDDILRAMASGADMDKEMRGLYNRLTNGELITPEVFISVLYDAI